MKKIYSLLLVVSILLLTSCSLEGFGMRKKFFSTNDSEIANDCFEKVIEAIQNQDGAALKSLFSDKALEEAQNIDETINELFGYYQGEMLSYNDWAGPGVSGWKNKGKYRKEYNATYDVETSQDKYRFAMIYVPMDTSDEDNVGIKSLYVIRFEDDTDPQMAYRGDGKNTPGININKRNNVPDPNRKQVPKGVQYSDKQYSAKLISVLNEQEETTVQDVFSFKFERAYIFNDCYISGEGLARKYNLDISISEVGAGVSENMQRIVFVDELGDFVYEFWCDSNEVFFLEKGIVIYPDTIIERVSSIQEDGLTISFQSLEHYDS